MALSKGGAGEVPGEDTSGAVCRAGKQTKEEGGAVVQEGRPKPELQLWLWGGRSLTRIRQGAGVGLAGRMTEDTELSVGGKESEELGRRGRLAGGSQMGLGFPSNQAPPIPSDALNVRIVTVMRRTWESTATSAR